MEWSEQKPFETLCEGRVPSSHITHWQVSMVLRPLFLGFRVVNPLIDLIPDGSPRRCNAWMRSGTGEHCIRKRWSWIPGERFSRFQPAECGLLMVTAGNHQRKYCGSFSRKSEWRRKLVTIAACNSVSSYIHHISIIINLNWFSWMFECLAVPGIAVPTVALACLCSPLLAMGRRERSPLNGMDSSSNRDYI